MSRNHEDDIDYQEHHIQMPIMSRASVPFVHSSLAIQHSPAKGRLVIASTTIEPATVLMVDLPYALVPAPVAHEPPFSICSNHKCHRRITGVNASFPSSTDKHQMRQLSLSSPKAEATHRRTRLPKPVRCSEHCGDEVVWCSHDCHFQDAQRHLHECGWLRAYRSQIQADESVVEFELLWLLVKIFIRKYFDEQEAQKEDPQDPVVDGQQVTQKQQQCTTFQTGISPTSAQSHFERRGWDSVWDLAGSPDYFPAKDVARWREIAEKYLVDQIQDVKCNLDQAMGIMYRLETNSFGLYPGITGIYPITSHEGRGEYYGSGLYPTAAMFNHSCGPNVSHQLDEHNRRVFTTNRQILQGEECCISYFDLVELQDAALRRHEIRTKWTFGCDCQRCQDDGDEKLPEFLLGLGMDSDGDDKDGSDDLR